MTKRSSPPSGERGPAAEPAEESPGSGQPPESEIAEANERYERTRQDHAQETAEDYVELIETLTSEQGEARLVDIARHLGISHVSVSRTINRLQREGLIRTRPYRSIFLTDAGRALARRIRVRHTTVLRFLCALGVPEKQAAIDAEGIEHHISDDTLAAFARYLAERRLGEVREELG